MPNQTDIEAIIEAISLSLMLEFDVIATNSWRITTERNGLIITINVHRDSIYSTIDIAIDAPRQIKLARYNNSSKGVRCLLFRAITRLSQSRLTTFNQVFMHPVYDGKLKLIQDTNITIENHLGQRISQTGTVCIRFHAPLNIMAKMPAGETICTTLTNCKAHDDLITSLRVSPRANNDAHKTIAALNGNFNVPKV